MDDEFKKTMNRHMAIQTEHMAMQTEFVGDIRRVALVYEQNAKAVRMVFKFLAWVVGLFASVFGILDFLRSR